MENGVWRGKVNKLEFTEIESFMEVGAFLKAVKANLLHGCSKAVTSQTEKEKYYRTSLICRIFNNDNNNNKKEPIYKTETLTELANELMAIREEGWKT